MFMGLGRVGVEAGVGVGVCLGVSGFELVL